MSSAETVHRIRLADGSASFECGPRETVLLAGLRAGLDLAYECAGGGCGTCKVTLIEGDVQDLWPAASGLSERDHRRGNRILLCQSRPRTACTIRPTGAPVQAPEQTPRPSRRHGRIAACEALTPDTMRLVVDCGRPVPYLAGQFVVLELPDLTRRAYSMAREPGAAPVGQLELLVRAKPGGAATGWLFDRLGVGDRLVVEGPYGRAFAQSPADRPVICVGGGSGIGPVLGIAERCLTETPDRRVQLYYGARSEEDVVLVDRFIALHDRGAAVTVVVDRGGPTAGRRPWGRSRTGLVVDAVSADHPDLTAHDLYVSGPTGMVDALLVALVRTQRAQADRVFFDRFVA